MCIVHGASSTARSRELRLYAFSVTSTNWPMSHFELESRERYKFQLRNKNGFGIWHLVFDFGKSNFWRRWICRVSNSHRWFFRIYESQPCYRWANLVARKAACSVWMKSLSCMLYFKFHLNKSTNTSNIVICSWASVVTSKRQVEKQAVYKAGFKCLE